MNHIPKLKFLPNLIGITFLFTSLIVIYFIKEKLIRFDIDNSNLKNNDKVDYELDYRDMNKNLD